MRTRKIVPVGDYMVTLYEREKSTKHGPRVTVADAKGNTVATFSVSKGDVKQLTGEKFAGKLHKVKQHIEANIQEVLDWWYAAGAKKPKSQQEAKVVAVPTTYVGISRDHSASMMSLVNSAKKDYNEQIEVIKKTAVGNVKVTTVKCGVGWNGANLIEHVGTFPNNLSPLTEYVADGRSTPLFDSVSQLIDLMQQNASISADGVYLIMAITDGEDNSSKTSGYALGERIKSLQKTDRWTFTFRVPKGYAQRLSTTLGIPRENILEWEQTIKGVERATDVNIAAMSNYFGAVAAGNMTASRSFYTDASNLKPADLKSSMADITRQVEVHTIPLNGGSVDVSTFSSRFLGRPLQTGTIFYQLMKREAKVQDYKIVCIRDKKTGKVFGGDSARDLLGIPRTGTHSIIPGNHGQYDVFVQSTSLNRKLPPGTKVLYWEGVPSK